MKPAPTLDYPVGVAAESREHPPAVGALYEGIYSVRLNHTVPVEFVPSFRRDPWPPALPDDVDDVKTSDEARRTVVALSRLSVTPDEARAGHEEVLPPDTESEDPRVVFFVSPREFEEMIADLSALAARLSSVHDGVPISSLTGKRLGELLEQRIVPSGHLSEYGLKMLGRV